jgi:Tfx family DNA-binding protein
MRAGDTHLTERQVEVLRLELQGKGVSEMAKTLGTSRSNVSRLLRTARENIRRSKNTLKLLETLNWPVRVRARRGAKVYEVAERVFELADRRGIRVAHNYAEVVRLITEFLGRRNLRRRCALRDFTILVSGDGKVEVL